MKPHRMDGVSLSFGLLFVAIAVWWTLSQLIGLELPNVGWLAAAALIGFGVIGLLGSIWTGRRAEAVTAPAAPAVDLPDDLPPQMHAEIVEELLADPTQRFARQQGHEPPRG